MCGICGFLEPDERPADGRLVQAMNDCLAHRGPDGEGLYLDGPVALGHRRLSIIDLGGGRQPMSTADEALTVVFNGEIYNYQALRAELSGLGHVFRTSSDTESILHAYRQWGEGAVARLQGMFAFALWDRAARRLLLARDRLGKKPLYYSQGSGRLRFASELKSLLADPEFPATMDPQALDAYLSYGYVPAPLSIYREARKLPPAHYMVVEPCGARLVRYWRLTMDDAGAPSYAQACEELTALFDQCVADRLMSDVPLGAFLSGGVDSSAVVASMARQNPGAAVRTAAIGFSEKAYDELEFARLVARHVGADHSEFTVRPEAMEVIGRIAWHFDEPFADASAIPTWYVSEMARRKVTVALSGDGGDEVFAGYVRRYSMVRMEDKVRRLLPGPLQALAGLAAGVYPRADFLPRPLRLKQFLANLGAGAQGAYFRDMSFLFRPEAKARLMRPELARQVDQGAARALLTRHMAEYGGNDPVSRAQYADILHYLPEDILVKVDRMSMAHGLEVRAPLLDHRILEFAGRLPSSYKLRGGESKAIFKDISRPRLPQAILERSKQGFRVPLAQWLRADLKELARETIFGAEAGLGDFLDTEAMRRLWDGHQGGLQDNAQQLYGLMMLGLWRQGRRAPAGGGQ